MDWIKQKLAFTANQDSWVLQVFIIVFLTLLVDFVVKKIIQQIEKHLQKTRTLWDDAILYSLKKPVSIAIWILGLSFAGDLLKFNSVDVVRELGIVFAVAWAIVRFIKQFEERLIKESERLGGKIDRTTADAIAQLLRMSVIITSALVALQVLGINISAVLAFGGIGGIAIGFAAKDLLANFFGGLMIYLDRPFAVGDWIRSPDKNIEGTVEKIGWRLTVIRTFDKRPLYVPNSIFATIAVENPSRMSYRRIHETIGIRYGDIEKMSLIVSEVKQMLLTHPDIATDQTMIVNFNKFEASSVDFFIYTFTRTTDWIEFHQVKQDVLLKISEIITSHKAEIAYPTRTMHVPDGIQVVDSVS